MAKVRAQELGRSEDEFSHDAETVEDDGVLVVVLISDALKIFFDWKLESVDFSRLVHCRRDRGDLKG